MASYFGFTEGVKILLSCRETKLQRKDSQENASALVLATQEGHLKVIILLLLDPRLDVKTNEQLEKAMRKSKHPEITKLLQGKIDERNRSNSFIKKLLHIS